MAYEKGQLTNYCIAVVQTLGYYTTPHVLVFPSGNYSNGAEQISFCSHLASARREF